MTVPRIFANLPSGLFPLSWFDDDFAYLLAQIGAIAPSQTQQIVTAGGTVVVGAGDAAIVLNKLVASDTPIQLPAANSRHGLALQIVDWAGNAQQLTISPAAGELIMGLGTLGITSVAQGAGTAAAIGLFPIPGLGWGVY